MARYLRKIGSANHRTRPSNNALRNVLKRVATIIVIGAAGFICGCLQSKTDQQLKNLKSDNIVIQSEAIFWLGEKRKIIAVSDLTDLLSEDHPKQIRVQAIRALGKIGKATPVNKLVAILSEADAEIVLSAAEALGKIRDPLAVKPLLGIIANDTARLTVIWSLGNIGDRAAIPVLTSLVREKDSLVRFNATRALKSIGGNK